ncbi:MAG: beta-mannosidase, partial [Thermoleophilaceae bacterium]|nr:beta-mannosidase [Thermoleophilaceae bacterium]
MGARGERVRADGLSVTALGPWQVEPGPPGVDADASEFVFRTHFECAPPAAGEQLVLCLDGLATVATVELNGEPVLESESMWLRHEVDVGALVRDANELVIRCLPLAPLLAERRKPRARWRTRLVDDGNLRWLRTSLLGRMPGIAPGPPLVGPWRGGRIERRGPGPWLRSWRLRQPAVGEPARLELDVAGGDELAIEIAGQRIRVLDGVAPLPSNLERWYPHTHGRPALHEASVLAGDAEVGVCRFGLRELTSPRDVLEDGLDLHVNGVPLFARGAIWTPVSDDQLRPTLEAVVAAGMNMLRVPGIGRYESCTFYDLCDELGILVWQDFMFANLDYPFDDAGFKALVEVEVEQVLGDVAGRASLAVLCGNSEIEQQVAMLGLDPALGRGPLFAEELPERIRAAGIDAVYVPSAPAGADLPFRPDRGVANYFGVGGYRRPLDDARRADVRFASECLAFANVPDGADAAWVPRDNGSTWDFADVREHYRALLFGDSRSDEIDRLVSGEVMAEVFGEWRRAGSRCRGALVLWLRDLIAGSGWGVLDADGRPKAAYHYLRRALAPIAVWTTDEGLGGVRIHVANDPPERLDATLQVALYRGGAVRVGAGEQSLTVAGGETIERDLESVLG